MSGEAKFTPGGWFRCGAHGGICVAYGLGHALLFETADLPTHGGQQTPGDVREGNESLVAAAPDMFDALMAYVAGCTGCHGAQHKPCSSRKCQAARAALAKARGES